MSTARVFDRVPQFDQRSRSFAATDLITARKRRSYTWRCPLWLDQGQEGACVGFSWAHEAAARPAPVRGLVASDAQALYRRARQLDPWEGENYSGTSVLAGAKAFVERGFAKQYRWAFGLSDLRDTLGYLGPAVLGVNWYEGMYSPDSDGYLHVDGEILGGHAILAIGVHEKTSSVLLHNSWGPSWGRSGEARISFDDLDRLLDEQGEACVAVQRAAG